MAASRTLQNAAATLTLNTFDANGTLADATGTVTVGVTRANGTTLVAAGTTTTHSTTGVYTVALTAAQTVTLDVLTATWTNATATWTTRHEIVGGFLFSLAEARAANNQALTDTTKYPDGVVLAARTEVEEELEAITARSFVRRYRRVIVDGSGTDTLDLASIVADGQIVPVFDVRTVRAVNQYGSGDLTGTPATFSASSLASIVGQVDGTIRRTDFGAFNPGVGNVVVDLEYGLDGPPQQVKAAALIRLRTILNRPFDAITDRATSYHSEDGSSYDLAKAGQRSTGYPDIDAIYQRWSKWPSVDTAQVGAVSMPLTVFPSLYGLYHGGTSAR